VQYSDAINLVTNCVVLFFIVFVFLICFLGRVDMQLRCCWSLCLWFCATEKEYENRLFNMFI